MTTPPTPIMTAETETIPEDIRAMSNHQLDLEAHRIESAWDACIKQHGHEAAQQQHGPRFQAVLAERQHRLEKSGPQVVRLRFLAGETSRELDAACGRALGWRVSRDGWWNWHPGPVFDPPGDAWCIRKDGRNDMPCDEALPHFTAESFDRALAAIRNPTP